MTDKPENPLAFPMSAKDKQGATMRASPNLGMTLRDYAIIKFTAAIVGNEESHRRSAFYAEKSGLSLKDQIIYDASGLADAMLKERAE